MYAFVPGKYLCLVYEDFYLAISNTVYEFIILSFYLPLFLSNTYHFALSHDLFDIITK